MKRSDQQKMIDELQYYSGNMSRQDRSAFEMLDKRNHDDEDLDRQAEESLRQLHERYVPRRSKKDAEELWKKLTSSGKQ